ncbi:flavodoxin family protein [Streptomyces sp. NPDC101234]|uniref:flavodoxin family protein n=1 Tax=Streptomyces sp. NPDC101234 TaxID=3366138 RepID=UPI003803C98E
MSSTLRPTVAVAFYSANGHTAALAEAVARGAAEAGAEVVSIAVDTITDEQWAQLDAADAIIFGSPTYMGTASAAFHAFAEAGTQRYVNRTWSDKIAAGFTISGGLSGDKSSTLGYFVTLAAQHGMQWVTLGLLPGYGDASSESQPNRLGYYVGSGSQSRYDAGAEAIPKSDIATAEHLGARVTQQTAIYIAGRAALAA